MQYNYIVLDPGRLNFPLAQCAVGCASSAVFLIVGGVPDDVRAIAVDVEYMDGDERRRYRAAGRRQSDGAWRVYFAPAYFPAAAEALKYHVIGEDLEGNPRWLGSGELRILDNPAEGGGVAPSVLPPGSYAYNPVTGLYHRLTAEVNENGDISVAVEQEGVEL